MAKKPEGKMFYVAVAQPHNSMQIEALNTFDDINDAAGCAAEAIPKYKAAWVETIEVKDPHVSTVTVINFTVGVR